MVDMNTLLERKDVEEKIVASLISTRENDKEQGFNFYNGRDIVLGKVLEGNRLSLDNNDRSNRKIIGALHTHTMLTSTGDILPSQSDVTKAIKDKLKFFCVGGIKENTGIVRCFDTRNIEKELYSIIKARKISMNDNHIKDVSRAMLRCMLINRNYVDIHSNLKVYEL